MARWSDDVSMTCASRSRLPGTVRLLSRSGVECAGRRAGRRAADGSGGRRPRRPGARGPRGLVRRAVRRAVPAPPARRARPGAHPHRAHQRRRHRLGGVREAAPADPRRRWSGGGVPALPAADRAHGRGGRVAAYPSCRRGGGPRGGRADTDHRRGRPGRRRPRADHTGAGFCRAARAVAELPVAVVRRRRRPARDRDHPRDQRRQRVGPGLPRPRGTASRLPRRAPAHRPHARVRRRLADARRRHPGGAEPGPAGRGRPAPRGVRALSRGPGRARGGQHQVRRRARPHRAGRGCAGLPRRDPRRGRGRRHRGAVAPGGAAAIGSEAGTTATGFKAVLAGSA